MEDVNFCELRYSPLEFNSWKKKAIIWHIIKRLGIRAMKFETARIQFLGDVSSAVAVVIAWAPFRARGTGKWKTGTKLRIRNKVNDRARVQVKFCSRFIYLFSTLVNRLWRQIHKDKPVRDRRIFSRPGSVKSWVPNFKLKTVNWSLRQEEW